MENKHDNIRLPEEEVVSTSYSDPPEGIIFDFQRKFEILKNGLIRETSLFDGSIQYYNKDGQYHRDNDLPAVISARGQKEWYVNGLRHRANGLPAIESETGYKRFFENGKRVEGKPFFIDSCGYELFLEKDEKERLAIVSKRKEYVETTFEIVLDKKADRYKIIKESKPSKNNEEEEY